MGDVEYLKEGDVVIAKESFEYFNELIDENAILKDEVERYKDIEIFEDEILIAETSKTIKTIRDGSEYDYQEEIDRLTKEVENKINLAFVEAEK